MYATKFVPQQTRTQLMSRSRLLNKLLVEHQTEAPLSLIVAPSGYGKSTLMAQFLSFYSQQPYNSVGWLNLDENDNDEDTFITALCECFYRSVTSTKNSQQNANHHHYPKTNHQERLQQLLNDAEQLGDTVRIILDDFQVLTCQVLLTHVDWLIRRLPANLFIYVVSKTEPEIPVISELRAKNNITEIFANELNFTLQESKYFFDHKNLQHINDEDIGLIHNKTEGWVAATQLFSLAIQNELPSSRQKHVNIIENMSGTDKDVVKYLSNSVFNLQEQQVKDFFLCTALLKRFNAELCLAVCDNQSSPEILDYVSNQGLFIFELDRERRWFRYHHLFREFLLGELEKLDSEKIQQLACRAAKWFEQQGYFEEAIHYYLRGQQFEKASLMIADVVVEVSQYHGNHGRLLKWVSRLPLSHMLKKPKIAICYAWSLLFTRDISRSDEVIKMLTSYTPQLASEQTMLTYNIEMLALIRGVMLGRLNEIRQPISTWLAKWPKAPVFERSVVLGLLGATCLHTHEFSLARKGLMQAKSTFEKIRCDYGVAWADTLYGLVHFHQGHLQESYHIIKNALEASDRRMGEHSYASATLNVNLSLLYSEMNENEKAKQCLNKGLGATEKHGVIDTAIIAYIVQARLFERSHQTSDAIATLNDGESFGRKYRLSNFEIAIVSERIQMLLRQGDYVLAKELLEERNLSSTISEPDLYTNAELVCIRSLKARLLLIEQKLPEAVALLNELIKECKQKSHSQILQSLALLVASAYFDMGKVNQAFRGLNQVIATALDEGSLALFLNEKYHLKGLFIEFINKLDDHEYDQNNDQEKGFIKQICQLYQIEFHSELTQKSPSDIEPVSALPTDSLLTKRESELLLLLKQGLSNKELAANLFVSESTVKWHLSRIYTKLGAKNRVDALKLFFRTV